MRSEVIAKVQIILKTSMYFVIVRTGWEAGEWLLQDFFLGLDGVKTGIVGHLPKPMLQNRAAANLSAFWPAITAAAASSPS